jgi:GTP-binding protein
MKGMAKSSATPGKTIAINFFEVNGDRYVVDLPGYGYARISAKAAEKMRKQILWYLEGTEARPDLVILVVDVRVGATEHDLDLLAVALRAGRSVLVLANKIDKLSGNERPKALSSLMRSLGDTPMVPFSAKTGEGRAEVLKVVLEVRRG